MQDELNQDKKEENVLSGTLISCPVAWIQTKFPCWLESVFRRIWPRNGLKSHTRCRELKKSQDDFGDYSEKQKLIWCPAAFVLNIKGSIQTTTYTIQARQWISKTKKVGYSLRFSPYSLHGVHMAGTYYFTEKVMFPNLADSCEGGCSLGKGRGWEGWGGQWESPSNHKSNYCDSSSPPSLLPQGQNTMGYTGHSSPNPQGSPISIQFIWFCSAMQWGHINE